MIDDFVCAFGRALEPLRGGADPYYEYVLHYEYHEQPDVTEFRVSWVGREPEIPEWLVNVATYEIEKRWVRHFISKRAKGKIEGVAVFDAPEVSELAREYVQQRYGGAVWRNAMSVWRKS